MNFYTRQDISASRQHVANIQNYEDLLKAVQSDKLPPEVDKKSLLEQVTQNQKEMQDICVKIDELVAQLLSVKQQHWEVDVGYLNYLKSKIAKK